MIKRQKSGDCTIKVTFAISLEEAPLATSVVGDFNDWDPLATPLKKRTNGTRSASVVLSAGEVVRFKYLTEGGRWFTDADADVGEDGDNHLVA